MGHINLHILYGDRKKEKKKHFSYLKSLKTNFGFSV